MLGQCYTAVLGYCDPVKAQKYNSEAQRILARIGDYRGLSWVLCTESDVALVSNNSDLAVTSISEQITRAASSGGFQHEMSAAMGALAYYLAEQGKFKEALQQGREALHKMEELGNGLQACETHAVVATILVNLGPQRLQEAQAHAEASQNIAHQSAPSGCRMRFAGRGAIALARGNRLLARRRAEEAGRISRPAAPIGTCAKCRNFWTRYEPQIGEV